MSLREGSATLLFLKALIPYSKANLKLNYRPSEFFADLEQRHKLNTNTSRNAFHRAVKKGLVIINDHGYPQLTSKGHRALAPFVAKKLNDSLLLIAFDIPENERWKRDHLRLMLNEFYFKKIQKSVWATDRDCAKYLEAEVQNLNLEKHIRMFEARSIGH